MHSLFFFNKEKYDIKSTKTTTAKKNTSLGIQIIVEKKYAIESFLCCKKIKEKVTKHATKGEGEMKVWLWWWWWKRENVDDDDDNEYREG